MPRPAHLRLVVGSSVLTQQDVWDIWSLIRREAIRMEVRAQVAATPLSKKTRRDEAARLRALGGRLLASKRMTP